MPRIDFREESRKAWGMHLADNEPIPIDNLKFGAILRIADSLERMEQPYVRLLESIEYLRNCNRSKDSRIATLEKQVAAYKGLVRRMKKQP